jgi:circadian clock protein KaiC
VIREEGFAPAVARIIDLIKAYTPAFLVVDSFRSFHNFSRSLRELSRYQAELATALSALAITSVWVGEYFGDEMPDSPEFAVVDSVVQLALQEEGVKDRRYLRVSKLRGSGYLAGRHSFDIWEGGLQVYPRLVAPLEAGLEPETGRHKTGIDLLDEMVPGGLADSSTTALFGPTGVGKTVACLQTLFTAIQGGEKALLATLGEDPSQLASLAAGFGWEIGEAVERGVLKMLYFASDSVSIDEFANKLLGAIRESGATRVGIDALNDLERATSDAGAFRDFTYALVKHLAAEHVSSMFTYEIPELFQVTSLSPQGVSHMAENVVLLSYLRTDSRVGRVMTVVKTRATGHDPTMREYVITTTGITAAGNEE